MKRIMIVLMSLIYVSLAYAMQQESKRAMIVPKKGTIDPQDLQNMPILRESGYLSTLARESGYLSTLANEMKVRILEILVNAFDLNDAIHHIRSIVLVDKNFEGMINDPKVTRDLIDLLTHRFGGSRDSQGNEYFWRYHPFMAKKLSTKGSQQYLMLQNRLLDNWQNVQTIAQAAALVSQGADPRFVDEIGKNSITMIISQILPVEDAAAIVAYLMQRGAWIDIIDKHGYTLLIHAIRNERYTIASQLIPELPLRIINWSNHFIITAAKRGFIIDPSAELYYPNDYSSALLAAMSKEWVEGVELLLKYGANKAIVSNDFMQTYQKRTAKSAKAQKIVALLRLGL